MPGAPTRISTDHPLIRALEAGAPSGWERVDAAFSVTVTSHAAIMVYSDGRQALSVNPPLEMIDLVRDHRAQWQSSPWWRVSITLTAAGELDIEYDYGEEPFPEGQLLAADAYRADLEVFSRERVPVWLGAYTGHGDRQRRGPRRAAFQARADRANQVWATLAEGELPPFPVVWARWATISAAFVAAGSEWGPRMTPSAAVFEGAARSGASLYALPHGRAVLSGGVWDAPELDVVYNQGAPMPGLYAGAPEWITDEVLDPRAAAGLLSFCYWWEAGRWYHGESPSAQRCATALPGVWTAETVREIITGLVPGAAREAVAVLVAAAESGMVTRSALTAVLAGKHSDIDSALHQFALAGLTATAPDPMPRERALAHVRDYITGRGLDTSGYPLSELTAERFAVGWMVYVPVADGEIAIGRAVFYIADDGTLEHSTSSVPPAAVVARIERDFGERHGGTGT